MEFEYNGVKMMADVIGGFQYNNKEYAVCSLEDDINLHKIIILQTEIINDTIEIKEIPDEEVEGVYNCFQQIKNSVMEEEVYE